MTDQEKAVENEEVMEGVVETAEEQQAQEAQDTTDGAVEELSSDDLSKQLVDALAEVASLKEQSLRTQADMQNVRRRAEKDVESAHKFGNEKFVKALLDVVDNLERAIESAGTDESVQGVVEGIKMTHKSFIDTFAKFSVEEINPVNAQFDPALHQAISMMDNPDVAANTVMAVMQKGYQLHGRLIRPAMVMVSKGGNVKKIDETA